MIYLYGSLFGFRGAESRWIKKNLGQQGNAVGNRISFFFFFRKTSHTNSVVYRLYSLQVIIALRGEIVGKSCFRQQNLNRKNLRFVVVNEQNTSVKEIGVIYILSKQKCTIRFVFVTKSVMVFRFSNSRKTNDVISYMGVKITML